MSGFTGPKDMDSLVDNATKCLASLEKDAKFPTTKIQHCAGIVLMDSTEVSFGVSVQDASGILLAYNKEKKWSPPLAMAMTGFGVGSLGFAEKKTIMVLNQAAVDTMAKSGGSINFGADANLTSGAVGGEVGGDVGVGKGGLTSSYAFSNSEGGIISLELKSCVIKPKDKINKAFYGDDKSDADVLAGNVDVPEGSKAAEIMAKVSALTEGN